jgi:hypothetical protein
MFRCCAIIVGFMIVSVCACACLCMAAMYVGWLSATRFLLLRFARVRCVENDVKMVCFLGVCVCVCMYVCLFVWVLRTLVG